MPESDEYVDEGARLYHEPGGIGDCRPALFSPPHQGRSIVVPTRGGGDMRALPRRPLKRRNLHPPRIVAELDRRCF
ncbi:MAG: hypothetical protein CME06_16900 [Gemmatimonadetes bacterium]|nr:hypothetical protein [Gemmatimonadota bacterium]